jgi:hypothetical protein
VVLAQLELAAEETQVLLIEVQAVVAAEEIITPPLILVELVAMA